MAPRRLFVDPLHCGLSLYGSSGKWWRSSSQSCLSVHTASSSLLAPRRGLTSTVFRFSVLDRRQMSMRIGCLFLIERLRFVAWCQHLADSDISVPKVITWTALVVWLPFSCRFGGFLYGVWWWAQARFLHHSVLEEAVHAGSWLLTLVFCPVTFIFKRWDFNCWWRLQIDKIIGS